MEHHVPRRWLGAPIRTGEEDALSCGLEAKGACRSSGGARVRDRTRLRLALYEGLV
jgi:hypothetical protein